VQRTPNWVVPRRDHEYSRIAQWAFAHVRAWDRLHRFGIWGVLEAHFLGFRPNSLVGKYVTFVADRHLAAHVPDPALRARLRPDYPIGCKRVLISDDFYPTLARDNVELVTAGAARFSPRGLVTTSGLEIDADVIVFATGFDSTHFLAPMRVVGLGGATLEDRWRDGAEAYLGMTVAGFPNLFMLYGPNTNLGHNSIIFMIECQARYIRQCISLLAERGLGWIDVRSDTMARFNAELQDTLARRVWASGCSSWYKTESGKITNNWSGFTTQYWWRTRRPDLDDFVLGGAA
jgi:cation diffusion facilitator CzcD-associated flavoprotein CzcO